jgi:hypothetical protein
MRRDDLAEAILSLAAPRERAASILGDFLEDDPGALRFWFLVGRTAMAQTWSQMAAASEVLTGIVVRSMIAESGLLLAACFLYVGLLFVAISICRVSFHADVPDWADASLQWALVNLLVPIWVGRWMARRYEGRVAPGALVLAGVHTVINLCWALMFREAARSGSSAHVDVTLALNLIYWDSYAGVLHSALLRATLYPVMVLAGAAFFRAGAKPAVS